MRAASSSLDEPLLTLVWGNWSGTHTSLWSQPFSACSNGPGWLLALSVWQEKLSSFYRSIFRFGWGCQSPAGAWTTMFPDPRRACGLSLLCQNWSSFVEYATSWAGCRPLRDESMHRTQAHCSMSPGDNPHFSCQAGFHSYFTGTLRVSLVSLLRFIWNNNLVLARGLVCNFASTTRFDSVNNKTKIWKEPAAWRLTLVGGKYIYLHVMLLNTRGSQPFVT